jgi:hypothetical protein
MRRTNRLNLLVCAAVVAVALVACSKSSSTTGPVDPGGVLGAYVLKTVNGSAPPGIYYISASQTLWLDTATIRINSNNTYSDLRTTTLIDVAGTHVATNTRTGTYTVSGNAITIAYTNDLGIPATETLTLTGRTLSVTEQGVALTFVK